MDDEKSAEGVVGSESCQRPESVKPEIITKDSKRNVAEKMNTITNVQAVHSV